MANQEDLFGKMWREISKAESRHLSFQQIEAYVDGHLDPTERELVVAHTELCEQCAAELRDLAQFAALLRIPKSEPAPVSYWARWKEWVAGAIRVPRYTWGMAAAAAALIIAIGIKELRPSGTAPPTASLPPASVPSPRSTSPAPISRGVELALAPTEVAKSNSFVPETVLEAPPPALGVQGSQVIVPRYPVLAPAKALAYKLEIENAPSDPEARATIAIKYGLYGEAEKQYQTLIEAGGEKAEKGKRLMEALKRLRGH
jgi:hypothetical protein